MRLIRDHILRTVHGKAVLMPFSADETDFHGMIVLNHTGEFLCRMLGQETDRASLTAALAQEYGMEPQQIQGDVDAFLQELSDCHMLLP